MGKSFSTLSIAILLFTACSCNQTNQQDHKEGTHRHADGTVHENHKEDNATKQEEFTVPADTTLQK